MLINIVWVETEIIDKKQRKKTDNTIGYYIILITAHPILCEIYAWIYPYSIYIFLYKIYVRLI